MNEHSRGKIIVPPRQICVSILIKRRDDTVEIKLARAEKFGQSPQLEHEGRGPLSELEDVFVSVAADYLRGLFLELRQN